MTRKLELDRDEDGEFRGFAVGKEAALRDWLFRKERAGDQKLFQRLYDKKRDKDPKRRAENIARSKKWQDAHPEEQRAHELRYDTSPKGRAKQKRYKDRIKAEQHARERERGDVRTCRTCGTTWCHVPGMKGRQTYCGPGRCTMISRTRWKRG